MADSEANIRIDIDTSSALASIKNLQRQISVFHQQMVTSGNAANAALSRNMQKSLVDSINATGKFSANLANIKSTTESFTSALERNKLSMGEYFRYAGASTKTFGRLFRSEFDTIDKVARERVKTLQTQYIKMGRDANGALQAIRVRPLALDMQNLGTQTAMAAQKQQLFNQLLKQGTTNLLNWGKNTQWAGRQLMVGFTIPLTMLGTVASRTFMKLEEQAIRFRRVYGEMFTTTAETEAALQSIKDLANEFTKYGVAVEKTMELAADAAAMGKMGADLTAQVAEATRLAVLGGVEQQEALKTTISLTSAFGVATEDLAKKTDFLNAVENQTVVSIEDLTIAVPKAGPVVKQLGGDVEDLAFFLTAMKEGGINASEGANALKSGLASLINPTGKATEMLQKFGINIQNIVESNKGDIKGLVVDFASALDTLDPLTRARAIEQLFGKFQFSRLSTLFQNVIGEGNQASRVLELSKATAEELAILSERELKRLEDSPAYKFQKAMQDLQASLAPIGEQFIKLVTPIIDFGTSLLKQFNNMSEGSKAFVTGLIAVLGLVAPAALMTIGLVANGVANLLKGFNSLRLFYQRLTGSSSELGAATQYMTQEQLEAAAVAASLNQSHATLTQTFTSESAALSRLIAVYQAATKAQLAMNAAAAGQRIAVAPPITRIPGGRRAQSPQGTIDGIPGYARGIVSVPGPKGAGDVVPAMLSPGEAVIPAKQAQKYSGIVSSLISDNVPGFRFGFNPFASMLGRSRVAVRMGSSNFLSALMANGKNARYQNAFETQTGADYIRETGSKTTRQRDLRSAMERDVFGLDPKTTPSSLRPTYGYAKTSILQSLINNLFGIKGKNFNSITRNPSGLNRYGDIDLITKGSVAKRSSAFAGDALVDYNWVTHGNSKRRFPNLNIPIKNTGILPAPMRGASAEQMQSFERFGLPFQQYKNPRPAYVETYTPGGFAFKEIEKVITNNPAIAKQLRAELKAAGLGSVKVSGPGFVQTLLKKLGIPGFAYGTSSVSATGKTGSLGAGLELSAIEKEILKKYNLNDAETSRYLQAKAHVSRNKKTVAKSISELKAMGLEREAVDLATRMAKSKVALGTQMSIMSDALTEAKKSKDDFRVYQSAALSALENKNIKGEDLKKQIRQNSNYKMPATPREEFAHIGSGAKKILASKVLDAASRGELNLKLSEIEKLKDIAARGGTVDVKSGLGFTLLNDPEKRTRLNALLQGNGATLEEFRKAFKRNGSEKWAQSVEFGGANPKDPIVAKQMKIFDDEFQRLLQQEKNQIIVDSEEQVERLARQKPPVRATSIEKLYSLAIANSSGRITALSRIFDRALQTGTEFRDKDQKYFKATPNRRALNSIPLSFLSSAGEKLLTARIPALKVAGSMFAGSRRASSAQTTFPGYAKGVVSVPGPKGAGDVVPAMLSPGEAVIPAQMSRKYAPLINSMIADNVPGYQDGLEAEGGRRGSLQGKIAGGGMLAGMGAMMYGMTGGPGANIASMASFPLMMLPMLLPMLSNAAGLAVVAIGALSAGLIFLNNKLTDATKSGLEAGKAMSMTNQKLEEMSEFTGKVTASQIAARKRENLLTGEGSKKRQFGQTFMESDMGRSLLANAESMIQSGMTSEVATNLANQLSYSILQGVLTPEQARSIAAGLGEELQNYSIAMSISGKLTELFGANGENLLNGDPLQISLAIQEKAVSQQVTAYENALSTATENAANDWVANVGGAITAVSTGLFAASGAAAVTGVGAVAAPILAAAGIITGAVGLPMLTVGNLMDQGDQEENNKARGVAVQLGAEQLAQNQGLVDSLERQYDNQIAQLEEEKKTAKTNKERLAIEQKISDKIAERESGIKAQKEANAEIFKSLVGQAKALGPGFTTAIGLAIDEKFKDATGAVKAAAELAKTSLADLSDGDFKIGLQIGLASGEFDPVTVSNLINADKDSNGQIGLSYNLLVGARGTADANTFIQLLGAANVGTQNYKIMLDFIIEDQADFDNNMEAISQIASMPMEYGFKVTATTELIGETGDFIRETKDLPETLTRNVVVKYLRNTENLSPSTVETLQGMLDNWDSLTNGTNELKYQVMVDFLIGKSNPMAIQALFAAMKPERYKEMLNSLDGSALLNTPNQKGPLSPITEAERNEMAAFVLGQGSQGGDDKAGGTTTGSTETGAGTRAKTWIDDVLKKLKNLTDASINAKGGLKELKRVIDGTKLNIFEGLGQKFSKAGISEAFADELMDMGKKARKKFVTIGKDGTAILTKAGERRQKAYERITLGQFNLDQVRLVQSTKDQTAAVNKLTGAGLSLADAYEAVQDKALAAAIAGNQLSKTALTKLIADIKAAAAATKEFQNVSSVRLAAEEANNLVKAANQLEKSTYSFAEQQAILSDSALTELFLSGRNQQLLRARVKQILTPEFLQGIFDEGFNAAMNAFAIKERKIELDFEVKTKPDMNIIGAAQNQIAGIEYIIDDLQAELKDIEDQEEKINESYNQRIKALDKVKDTNDRIANQQKGQLAVAEALSKGDIAAAAKAIQELRATEAQNRLEQQRKALDLSKEKDLARLTSKGGKTRKQLEEEIKKLQDEIFQIEEERLEPAQERVRLAEIEKNSLIESVTVLDRTRLAWTQIENSIDQARIGSTRYTESISDAIAMVDNLKTAWQNATPGGTQVDIPAAEVIGGAPAGQSALDPRYIANDTKFNQMVDLYRAMNEENKNRFKEMVEVGPGTNYANWKANRLSGKISNANLDRAISLMKNGIISNAEIAEEKTRGFSFNKNLGGKIQKYSMGSLVPGIGSTDKVPGLLTPGEFVVRKAATKAYLPQLKAINSGLFPRLNAPSYGLSSPSLTLAQRSASKSGQTMYNNTYSIDVNVSTDANPNEIARAVMTQIKQIDSQRIRSNRF